MYLNVTGHAPVFPRWASGYWQSKNRYRNRTQLLDVVGGFKRRGLNLSLIAIDYYNWSPSGVLGDLTMDPTCWPEPKDMVAELRGVGVEPMLSAFVNSMDGSSANFAAASPFLAQGPDGKPSAHAGNVIWICVRHSRVASHTKMRVYDTHTHAAAHGDRSTG